MSKNFSGPPLMTLRELNYQFTGTSNGLNELYFDCPRCGSPYRVVIHARLNGPSGPAGVWEWRVDGNEVTVEPSIVNQNHGKKKLCGWHGHVTKGVVITDP